MKIIPPKNACKVVEILNEAGFRALFAGGCVRDFVLDIKPKDWDIVTNAKPEEVKKLFDRTIDVGEQFGVIRVLMEGEEYEVATFRKDGEYVDGRHPKDVVFAIEQEDAFRRDFTINSMFYDLRNDEIIDHTSQGMDDLTKEQTIRAIGNPKDRFQEDYLRMLRAVRFAAHYNMILESDTYLAINEYADKILDVSQERIYQEITRMLTGNNSGRALSLLNDTGLLKFILPEVHATVDVLQNPVYHPEGSVWIHILKMLELNNSDSHTLAWGILLHDIGKPITIGDDYTFYGHEAVGAKMALEICERFKMSNKDTERIHDLVANHMRFLNTHQMKRYKLKRFLRQPYMDELLELYRLDCMASNGNLFTYALCLETLKKCRMEDSLRPPKLLDGHDLVELGYEPGPKFGTMLRDLENQQLEGVINNKEQALEYMQECFPIR